jgi:hypothetical protein
VSNRQQPSSYPLELLNQQVPDPDGVVETLLDDDRAVTIEHSILTAGEVQATLLLPGQRLLGVVQTEEAKRTYYIFQQEMEKPPRSVGGRKVARWLGRMALPVSVLYEKIVPGQDDAEYSELAVIRPRELVEIKLWQRPPEFTVKVGKLGEVKCAASTAWRRAENPEPVRLYYRHEPRR